MWPQGCRGHILNTLLLRNLHRGLFGRFSRRFFHRLAFTLNTTHLPRSNRKFANREDMLDRFTTLHEEISL